MSGRPGKRLRQMIREAQGDPLPERPPPPSSFDYMPEYALVASGMAKLGATYQEIADQIGVTTATLLRWATLYPQFNQALRIGEEYADERVISSLYSRAVGFEYETEKVFMTKDGDVVRESVTEQVLPDPNACATWLRARQPEKWREVQRAEVSLEVKGARDRIVREINSISDRIQGRVAQLALRARAPGDIEPADG